MGDECAGGSVPRHTTASRRGLASPRRWVAGCGGWIATHRLARPVLRCAVLPQEVKRVPKLCADASIGAYIASKDSAG